MIKVIFFKIWSQRENLKTCSGPGIGLPSGPRGLSDAGAAPAAAGWLSPILKKVYEFEIIKLPIDIPQIINSLKYKVLKS